MEERKVLGAYASYDSGEVNNDFIKQPDQTPLFNKIIEKLPPVENDIVVWRYIREYEIEGDAKNRVYLPPDSGEYEYLSYLSTSFMSQYVITYHSCQNQVLALMRIVIPKGSKCLYVPSVVGRVEYEILLPHKTHLRIDGKEQQSFVCSGGEAGVHSLLLYGSSDIL